MLKRLVFSLLLACAATSLTVEAECSAAELIEARLQMMKAVAAHKSQQGQPVEDRAREKKVLEAAVRSGLDLSVD